ncbi:MAG: leucyl aminopeptidase [Hydrogenophilus sp.]|nr:leucyl aminopeptidase [Hydrogenophilus sp.]
MNSTIRVQSFETLTVTTLAIALFADNDPLVAQLDQHTGGRFGRLWNEEPERDKVGRLFRYAGLPGLACDRLWVVSLGEQSRFTPSRWAKAAQSVAAAFAEGPTGAAAHTLALVAVEGLTDADKLRLLGRWFREATYRYDATLSKSTKENSGKRGCDPLIHLVERDSADLAAALAAGEAVGESVLLARRLGDLPANLCTPEFLAKTAQELAEQHHLHATILNKKAIEKLGMEALLAVAAGAKHPPRFILLEYHGSGAPKEERRPIALVGKGITFDTGGICLKPSAQLDEMKYDMCGAAAVLGVIDAAARLSLPIDLVAAIPATENMPSGEATRPGDVVTTLSGKTVEILNTDAEGRLILCDALTYVQREYRLSAIVDIATLTGAIVIALGKEATGLMGNNDTLIAELQQAGERAHDRAWPLPLWEEYQDLLKSRFADLANIASERGAGSITGAAFLSRFIEPGIPWAHLDIAGTAWKGGDQKGATGRPIPLLVEWLRQRAGSTSSP